MANFNSFTMSGDTEKKKNQMEISSANMDKAAADYNKMNYGSFVQGDDYKALSQRYQQNGQMAMKDTLGQMAARTGGMASSYANTASQQAYNGYMEKLEDAARSLYDSQRQEKMDALNVATSIYNCDNAAYESGYANDYNKWRADVGDQQWNEEFTYTQEKDSRNNKDTEFKSAVGAEDFDWMEKFDTDRDGEISEEEQSEIDEFFSGSNYGSDYWYQYWNDAQAGYTQDGYDAESDKIKAMLANGETLEQIATKYGIDGTNGKTWEDVTGMSEAEWTNIAMENMTSVGLWNYMTSGLGLDNQAQLIGDNTALANKFDEFYGYGAFNEFKAAVESLTMRADYGDAVDFLNKHPEMASEALKFFEQIHPLTYAGGMYNGTGVTGLINSDEYKNYLTAMETALTSEGGSEPTLSWEDYNKIYADLNNMTSLDEKLNYLVYLHSIGYTEDAFKIAEGLGISPEKFDNALGGEHVGN